MPYQEDEFEDQCTWVELRHRSLRYSRCHRLVMTEGLCLKHYRLWQNLERERLRYEGKPDLWNDDDVETRFGENPWDCLRHNPRVYHRSAHCGGCCSYNRNPEIYWEDLTPEQKEDAKLLRQYELNLILRMSFPVEAQWGKQTPETVTILGPIVRFEPYKSHPIRGGVEEIRPIDALQLMGILDGKRVILMADSLYYERGEPWLTPFPERRTPPTNFLKGIL